MLKTKKDGKVTWNPSPYKGSTCMRCNTEHVGGVLCFLSPSERPVVK